MQVILFTLIQTSVLSLPVLAASGGFSFLLCIHPSFYAACQLHWGKSAKSDQGADYQEVKVTGSCVAAF